MKKEKYGRDAARRVSGRKRAELPMRLIRALRTGKWTAAWYGFLILAGMRLHRAGAVYAMRWRGYHAVGGEVLIPLLPVLCSGLAATVWKILRCEENSW